MAIRDRNKLNHILRITEIEYYKDLLSEHESNYEKIMASN